MSNSDPAESPDYFYGFGFGMGIFSSIFASAGLFVISGAWGNFLRQETWTPQLLMQTLFTSLFGVPFVAVPLIISASTGIWLVGLIGYSIPFTFCICLFMGRNGRFNHRNPFHLNGVRYNHNHNRNHNRNDIEMQQPRIQQVSNSPGFKQKNMSIWHWLNDIGLTEYYQLFITEGYTTVKDLETITNQDLQALKITKHFHVRKILDKINESQQYTNNKTDEGIPGPQLVYNPGAADDAPPSYNELSSMKQSYRVCSGYLEQGYDIEVRPIHQRIYAWKHVISFL